MKRMRAFFIAGLITLRFAAVNAQDAAIIRQYVETYKELAIEEMQRTGVPASIKLAQGIHETMAGTSVLVQKSNNHFGIKCKSNWTGESVSHDDDARGECFRKYPEAIDSYRDHSNFLKNNGRYASLFSLDPLDYSGWAYGLKKAGYATNPRYPLIIIRLIEEYHLQDYSLVAMERPPQQNVETTTVAIDSFANSNTITKEVSIEVTEEDNHELPPPPSGEYKINDTRVVYGTKGTPLLLIAQQYNVPLSRLFEFNDMPEAETLPRDQLVYLQRKRRTGNNEFHTVKQGETLWDISQTEAISLQYLLEYNQLKAHMQPATGERLYLRKPAPSGPRLAKQR